MWGEANDPRTHISVDLSESYQKKHDCPRTCRQCKVTKCLFASHVSRIRVYGFYCADLPRRSPDDVEQLNDVVGWEIRRAANTVSHKPPWPRIKRLINSSCTLKARSGLRAPTVRLAPECIEMLSRREGKQKQRYPAHTVNETAATVQHVIYTTADYEFQTSDKCKHVSRTEDMKTEQLLWTKPSEFLLGRLFRHEQ